MANGKFEINSSLEIGLPYAANIEERYEAKIIGTNNIIPFKWNGFQAKVEIPSDSPVSERTNSELLQTINSPIEELNKADFVPITRGFKKPYYTLVPMTGTVNSEEEIATLLKTEKKVNTLELLNLYLEEIAERIIELPSNGAAGVFSLKATNTKTGQSSFLVNEGAGTNELVTILAKVFQYNKQCICIDEPEIHLHPSMVRKLARSFVKMSNDHDKQFLVSTHSEHFVQALLSCVAEGKIKPQDIEVYHLTMSEAGTRVDRQSINDKGQIEGGLSHFYEAELTDYKSMFKLTE